MSFVVCDDGHEEICFDSSRQKKYDCPLCAAKEDLAWLQEEIDKLEEEK